MHLTLDANEHSHLLPEASRGCCDGVLVSVNDRTLPGKVDLMGTEPASLLVELPEDEKTRGDDLHGVVLEEALDIPGLE